MNKNLLTRRGKRTGVVSSDSVAHHQAHTNRLGKPFFGLFIIACFWLCSSPVFAQWTDYYAPGLALLTNDYIKVTCTGGGGSVAGTNNYRAYFGNGNDIIADVGNINTAFNTVPLANQIKAQAGKPVTVKIEFDLYHSTQDWNTSLISPYDQQLNGGIGKNEQGYAYDQYINIPKTSFVDGGRRHYTYEGTYTFSVGRTRSWLVFGYTIRRNNQYFYGMIVLPFVVEGSSIPANQAVNILGYTKEPAVPYMVLHNPPGDNSTVTFATNQEACRTFTETATDAQTETGKLDVTLGIAGSSGLFVTVDFEFSVTASASFGGGQTSIKTKNTQNCVSVLNAITTAPSAAGAGNGSIFIGYSTNLAYGVYPYVKITSTNPAAVKKDTGLVFAPVEQTPFFWTKQQIKNDIVAKQNIINAPGNTPNDIKIKNESLNQIKLWNQVLLQDSLNTYNPTNEVLTPTFELSGGVVIDNSKTVSTSTTTSLELTHFITASAGVSFVVKMGGSGVEGGFEFTTTKTFGQSVANTNNSSTTIAYHLYDDDAGDVFPVKIVRDPAYGTPIFLVGQGAKSSCPYEGGYQRDQPSLRFQAVPGSSTYTVPNVAVGTTSQFGIRLCNNSNETRTYNLRFNPQSNANNAIVSVSGTTGNTEFGAFTISPNTCNPNTFFVNVTQQNPGALSSPNLNLELYSFCDQAVASDIFATANWGNYALPTNITANKSELCAGSNVSLAANCANGTVTWFDAGENGTQLGTGSPLVHSPTANTNYYVTCQSGIYNYERIPAKTILVATPATNLNLTTNYSSGKTFQVATQALTATNKVIAPAGAIYRAGAAVTLNNGFEARSGTVFRAEIGGCN